jgi:hypothetical protein
MEKEIKQRLDYLRGEIEKECVSYGELAELAELAEQGHIPFNDTSLLEWAGVSEEEYDARLLKELSK